MVNTKIKKVADFFIIFSQILTVAALTIILLASVRYYVPTLSQSTTLTAKLFWSGLLIAIANGCMEFMKYSINTIVRTKESFGR